LVVGNGGGIGQSGAMPGVDHRAFVRGQIGTTTRQWFGLIVVVAGAAAVVAGSTSRWVAGGVLRDSDVANSTQRWWMAAAAAMLVGTALLGLVLLARASVRLGWVQVVACLHLVVIVGASTFDTSAKIGSTKPPLGDRLGWGLWLACLGSIVAVVGTSLSQTERVPAWFDR
jgi:hypothetical protein